MTHDWRPSPSERPLGCTVVVREAGPVTNPLCNIASIVECNTDHPGNLGLPLRCCEARCRRHAAAARIRAMPAGEK